MKIKSVFFIHTVNIPGQNGINEALGINPDKNPGVEMTYDEENQVLYLEHKGSKTTGVVPISNIRVMLPKEDAK